MNNLEVERILRENGMQYRYIRDGLWLIPLKRGGVLLEHDEDVEELRFFIPLIEMSDDVSKDFLLELLRLNMVSQYSYFAVDEKNVLFVVYEVKTLPFSWETFRENLLGVLSLKETFEEFVMGMKSSDDELIEAISKRSSISFRRMSVGSSDKEDSRTL